MAWSVAVAGGVPDVEEVISRLAYYLSERTRKPAIEEQILKTTKINIATLRRYRRTDPDAGRADVANGPRRLDVYYDICQAIGDNAGLVMWAASVSGSFEEMLDNLEVIRRFPAAAPRCRAGQLFSASARVSLNNAAADFAPKKRVA